VTTWCNHLNRPSRCVAVLGLKRVVAALEAGEGKGWGPVTTVRGVDRDTSGARREWSGELVWRDSQILTVNMAPDARSDCGRISIEEDLRCRRASEPQRGMGMEAAILSDWLAGFEPPAVDRHVLARAERSAAYATALVRAAAYTFDVNWVQLGWYPGRGRRAATLWMSKERACMVFGDRMQPGIHRVFSPKLGQLLAREGNRFMHVKKSGVSKRNGVLIQIGPGLRVGMFNKAAGTVEILRALQDLPEGVHL
jgi:hypothetical protein